MQVLFVHGMGRSPLSGARLLWLMRREGFSTASFGYAVTFSDFAAIRARLIARIINLAEKGEYLLVGHSLGGVLIRAAIGALPVGTRQPAHVFLLGSPVMPSRLAMKLSSNKLFRLLTRDCGHLLGSTSRMSELGTLQVPVTAIIGVKGNLLSRRHFDGELNDGVVALSEVAPGWITDQVRIETIHTLLPYDKQVAEIILGRLAHPAGYPWL